jgi:hypothetical protein
MAVLRSSASIAARERKREGADHQRAAGADMLVSLRITVSPVPCDVRIVRTVRDGLMAFR